MLQITPNLHFHGQCKQAVQLYKEAFGAQVKFMLSEADANPNDGIGTQRLLLNDSSNAKHLLQ